MVRAATLVVAAFATSVVDPAAAADDTSTERTPAAGILPLPDYSGDIWTRPVVSGDWGGARTALARKGVQIDARTSVTPQSVLAGGANENTSVGGKTDLLMYLDLQRMGLVPKAFVKIRVEGKYGNNALRDAGTLFAVNTEALFPITSDPEKDKVGLSDLLYTQYLTDTFGVFIGKADTIDGDANEFANGRGANQFMNFALVTTPAVAISVPYSTLGAGAFWAVTPRIQLRAAVFDTNDSSTDDGFGTLGDDWSANAAIHTQYRLFDLPGGHVLGGVYAWDNTYMDLRDASKLLSPETGARIRTENETWAIYANGWQYADVFTKDVPDVIDLGNGEADLAGWGLFWRVGLADQSTNLIRWYGCGGVGGRGIIAGRPNDAFGVGYLYLDVNDRVAKGSGLGDGQGVELFYNVALTPWLRLTPDLQIVQPSSKALNTAYIAGLRLQTRL